MEPVRGVAFVGIARNSAHVLPALLPKIAEIGEDMAEWTYVLLESDSYDDTFEHLRRFDEGHGRGLVRTYGDLRNRYPGESERLAFLRNAGLRLLEDAGALDQYARTIVMDLSEVNEGLEPEQVLGVLHDMDSDWAGVFPNQTRRYVDVWALRHEEWSPDDCLARVRNRPPGMSRREAHRVFVESRRIRIPPEAEPIEVLSAYGGLAIYDSAFLRGCSYAGRDDEGQPVSEHVSVNAQIRAKGGRLVIDPSLVNNDGRRSALASTIRRATYWLRTLPRRLSRDESDDGAVPREG